MALKIVRQAPIKLTRPVVVDTVKETKSAKPQAKSKPQAQAAEPVSLPPALPTEISLDSLIASIEEQQPFYGQDLTGALANLAELVAKEGASMAAIGTGLCRVNDLLLAKPELCTEIMLPPHLGILAKAAYAYTDIATEAGEARASKSSKAKPAAVPEDDTALD